MQNKQRFKRATMAPQVANRKRIEGSVLFPELGSDSIRQSDHTDGWLAFMAYLAYLFATHRAARPIRPQPPYEITGLGDLVGALRLLIVIAGLVLIVVALVAAGAPEEVVKVISQWSIVP